jgi:hypothetical protein
MLFSKTISVCYQNRTERADTFCGHNTDMRKLVVRIGLLKVDGLSLQRHTEMTFCVLSCKKSCRILSEITAEGDM